MRSKTRSEVKWLVNQAAALAGELARLDEEAARLAQRRAQVAKAHQACVQTLSVVVQPEGTLALPTVRVHRSYGGRGQLRLFLQSTLEELAPGELDSNELALRAVVQFGLMFSSPDEFYQFKNNSVGRALRALEQAGIIESTSERYAGPSAFGTWRWKSPLPSLDELTAQAVGGGTNAAR